MWRERSVWEAGDDAGDAWGGAGVVGAVHGAGLTQPHHVHRGGVAELPLGCRIAPRTQNFAHGPQLARLSRGQRCRRRVACSSLVDLGLTVVVSMVSSHVAHPIFKLDCPS